MKYKCLIVDDEKFGRELIKSYLSQFDQFVVESSCSTGLEAIRYLSVHKVDLLFLDINMPQITGIEILRQEKNLPHTILTTAYSEYALEGYNFDIVDYLLKPISLIRFSQAIDKFLRRVGDHNKFVSTHEPKSILVKSEHKLIKINTSDILFIEAMEKYIRIHTLEGRFMTLMSMMQILDLLPETYFMRIHRSYIVAVDKVDSLEANLAIIGEMKLPISKGNRKVFKERFTR